MQSGVSRLAFGAELILGRTSSSETRFLECIDMLEMARIICLKSNTIQTREDITEAGEIAGPEPRTLYGRFGGVCIDISG